jgi:hypothetical protein
VEAKMAIPFIFQALGSFVVLGLYRRFVSTPMNEALYKQEIVSLYILLKALDYYESEKGRSESTENIREFADDALSGYRGASEVGIGGDGNFASIKEADKNLNNAANSFKKLPEYQKYLDKAYASFEIK